MKSEKLKGRAKGRPSRSALGSHVACFVQPFRRTKRLIYRFKRAIMAATTPHLHRARHVCVPMCAAGHVTHRRVQLEVRTGKGRCPRGSRHPGGFPPPPPRPSSRRVPGGHVHVGGRPRQGKPRENRACRRRIRESRTVLEEQLEPPGLFQAGGSVVQERRYGQDPRGPRHDDGLICKTGLVICAVCRPSATDT